jgi:hypothetical protein
MKKIAYVIIICLCLTGCQKCKKNNGPTIVSGLVLDEVTGQAVPNATVVLGILNSGLYGVSATSVESKTTDAYGRYYFEFKAQELKDYAVIGAANMYFTTESVSQYPIKENQTNNGLNIYLKPIATVKIHVKKTDMSYDSLTFQCDLNESGTTRGTFGKSVDTNLIYKNQVAGINKHIYIYI